jgi:uncharacterized protein
MAPAKKEILAEIIADFHQRDLPLRTPRHISMEMPPSKIITLTGVRRAGKTYCLYQIVQTLLDRGIPKTHMLFINFEDERLMPMETQELGLILDAYYELHPETEKKTVYLFFDEIQNVPGWERFVRRVHESENAQIFITGSSAKLLSREIATALRGRTLNYEIYPFSFPEYLAHHSIRAIGKSGADKAKIRHALTQYLDRGGFPEVLSASEMIWRKVLQEYIDLIVYRDVVERYQIKNHPLIKYLVKFLLKNIASPLTIHKLYRDLKSQGYSVSKDTLHLYLSYLEEAYAFFTIPLYSESVRVQNVHYRKSYTVDVGLANAAVFSVSARRGLMLENAVFLQLKRTPLQEIFYYKNTKGEEIDFLLCERGGVCGLIQVTENLDDRDNREGILASLWRAMEELGLSKASIVTKDTAETFTQDGRVIEAYSFWQWVNL